MLSFFDFFFKLFFFIFISYLYFIHCVPRAFAFCRALFEALSRTPLDYHANPFNLKIFNRKIQHTGEGETMRWWLKFNERRSWLHAIFRLSSACCCWKHWNKDSSLVKTQVWLSWAWNSKNFMLKVQANGFFLYREFPVKILQLPSKLGVKLNDTFTRHKKEKRKRERCRERSVSHFHNSMIMLGECRAGDLTLISSPAPTYHHKIYSWRHKSSSLSRAGNLPLPLLQVKEAKNYKKEIITMNMKTLSTTFTTAQEAGQRLKSFFFSLALCSFVNILKVGSGCGIFFEAFRLRRECAICKPSRVKFYDSEGRQ